MAPHVPGHSPPDHAEGATHVPLSEPCTAWDAIWPCDISCESPAITGQAVQFATELVWALSGRQFGLCAVKLRPCRNECLDTIWPTGVSLWPGTSWLTPALIGGLWYNIVCDTCPGTCSCTKLSEVYLPAPVNSIVEVKIDGTILDPQNYRLDNNRILVRTDDSWPRCNDLNLEDTELNTWSVTANFGQSIPSGGHWAVGEVACELIKAFKGEDCRLPRNITQLIRQGVTIQYPDINTLIDGGKTGLYMTDMWISTVNPHKLKRRSKTYSIDRPQHRRTGV